MRFVEVFRFELAYRLRRATTWIYGAILFVLAFTIVNANAGRTVANLNAPASLAEFSVFVGMWGVLVTAALFGEAAVRDVEAAMDPLVFTSRLSKSEYLGGRFLATLAVNAGVLLAIPLGLLVATLRYQGPAPVGQFRTAAFVQPFLFFLLPNVVLVGALLFTIAMLARRVLPAYLGAIGLFIGYAFVLNVGSQIQNPILSALADPFGISALLRMVRYWTTADQNTRLVGFPATLVLNRAVCLTVAAALLAFLHRRFRFVHPVGGGRRSEGKPPIADPVSHRARLTAVPRVAGTFVRRTRIRQTIAVARNALEEIAGTRAFVAALLVAMGLVLLWGRNASVSVFDASTWPVTAIVAETVLSDRMRPLFFLLIALYAGELTWKDRDVGVAEITDAAPVPNGVVLLGRYLAIVAIIAAFQVACMASGIVLLQALYGYFRFEPGLYLRIVFGINLVNYLLLAALAMTIHVIVDHKYLGHIVVLMAFAFTVVAELLGIRHHLLVYGTDPGWTYSDMNAFGPFIVPFIWFKLYWAAWALLLAVIAIVFLVRGRDPGLRRRLREVRSRFAGPVTRATAVALVLILVLGGFIFYNTNVLNAYVRPAQAGLAQAEYERRYKQFGESPQPVIVDAELRVEIYPETPAVEMRGTYRLVNRTSAAIDSVHVILDPKVDARSISFDRVAKAVLTDTEVGYRIYALERPLEPEGSLRLAFDVSYRPRGFPNRGIQTDVARNGAYFNRRWMPIVGYQPALELSDAAARRRFALRPRPPLPSIDDAEAPQYQTRLRDGEDVHVKTIIGTADDQTAVTPGVLRRSWVESGRRYFEYETERPTAFGATVFSARYAVLDDQWNDRSTGSRQAVDLRIYHHPTHTYALGRMMRSMKASLDYYTAQFGAYPDHQLRIVEIPRYGRFGRAHPHTLAFTEDIFLSRAKEGEFDRMFFGTAHEIAHQWWGGQLRTDRGVLSESLANYSAMMVTEKTFGPAVARELYAYQMDRYLRRRAEVSRDVPLLEATDQAYIIYGKGAVVMYLLREQIGEDRVNTALRRLLEKHRAGVSPYPTSSDLYAELRAVTPDSLQSLLVDLFETITLWDVKTERAVVEPAGVGEYRITLDVVAKKMRADSSGKETEVPMDDFVDVGIFEAGKADSLGPPVYMKQHRIRSGKQTITVIVPRQAARAGIDPYRKLIERDRDNNVVDVQVR